MGYIAIKMGINKDHVIDKEMILEPQKAKY